MKKSFRVLAVTTAAILTASVSLAQPKFTDKTFSPRERAEDLASRLTLEEKASLLQYYSPAIPRLGIKHYNWWNEALHGVARNGKATVYPMPIAMASSFDPELIYKVFTSVSDEARVKYNIAQAAGDDDLWYKGLTFWTPNINIFRHPFWGRGFETYGEDPYLTGQLGMEVVRGLQGPREDGNMKAQACAKHYAVHSGPEWSRHTYNAVVSERDLWETYLPAFKDLVVKADVDEVMFAYNSLFGVPVGGSKRMMKDILVDEWGFDGIIVSDCGAVDNFYKTFKWVESPAEAIAAAVKAGMDVECGWNYNGYVDAVRTGLLEEKELEDCVADVLEVRYRLGEMDGESPWDNIPYEVLCSEEHKALALNMARKSIVLLENKGILPLADDLKFVLMGPNAADSVMMWGNYNGFPLKTVTLYDALKERCPQMKYVPGCPHVAGMYNNGTLADGITTSTSYDPSKADFDYKAFVAETEGYGTVIFAGGISPRLEGEEMPVSVPGFRRGDRTTIELPEVQKKLIKALHDAGKKIVFVNFSGSAVGLEEEAGFCDAIVQAWYLGQEGGTALAEVLYGDINPSGKLPVTFYTGDSQVKDVEDYEMKGATYRFFEGKPQYPFGHGLSYTSFSFGRGKIVKAKDGASEFVVKVKNCGKREGETVVQLYVSRPDDTEGPLKTLRGFKRIYLKAGEKKTIRIPVDEETFLWWNPEKGRMTAMPGKYVISYGETSDDKALKSIYYSIEN